MNVTKLTLTPFPRTLAPRSFALCLLSATSVAGELPRSACETLPGTYLATETDREGVFASRSLLTFTADGNLLVTDSRHSEAPEPSNPVSPGQGSWHCVASTPAGLEIEAVALHFATAGQDGLQNIQRVNYRLKLDAAGTGLTGTEDLMVADATDLEGAEPISDPGELIDTFGIDAIKLIQP